MPPLPIHRATASVEDLYKRGCMPDDLLLHQLASPVYVSVGAVKKVYAHIYSADVQMLAL
jgi:hypothetical protein